MSKTYPPYLEHAEKSVGKLYPKFRASITAGQIGYPDPEFAYNVANGKITYYGVESKVGLFRTKFNFHASGSSKLTKDSTVELSSVFKDGSGTCYISTPEMHRADFWIYEDIKGFVADVQREIDNAPS